MINDIYKVSRGRSRPHLNLASGLEFLGDAAGWVGDDLGKGAGESAEEGKEQDLGNGGEEEVEENAVVVGGEDVGKGIDHTKTKEGAAGGKDPEVAEVGFGQDVAGVDDGEGDEVGDSEGEVDG